VLTGCNTSQISKQSNDGLIAERGLYWMLINTNNKKNWKDADEYCSKSAFKGLIGWRLPTEDELWPYISGSGFYPRQFQTSDNRPRAKINDNNLALFTCVRNINTRRNKEAEEKQAREEAQREADAAAIRKIQNDKAAKEQAKLDMINESQETLIWFSDSDAKFSPKTDLGRKFNRILVDMHNANEQMRVNFSVGSSMARSGDYKISNMSRSYSDIGLMHRRKLDDLTKEFIELWNKQGMDFKSQFKNSSNPNRATMLVPNTKQKINPFVRVFISQNKTFLIERITAYAPGDGEGLIVLYGK
jgi:hypothetical protein